jgi:hypothetical protein
MEAKMKKYFWIFCLILLVMLLSGCESSYINTNDSINDNHEKVIKNTLSKNGYTDEYLSTMYLKYLGSVNGYSLYEYESNKEDVYKYKVEFEGELYPTDTNKVICTINEHDNKYWPLEGALNADLYDYSDQIYQLIIENEE